MYRGDMFSQAFIRSQLKRLDANNALRVENCEYLTMHLSGIDGIETPITPEGCEPVYYNYVIGFDPTALGLDISARTMREKVQAALRAEGVPTGQWQRLPVPSQEIFRTKSATAQGVRGGAIIRQLNIKLRTIREPLHSSTPTVISSMSTHPTISS